MKYEFLLDDYYETMDIIYERDDVETYGFKQIKVAESENRELYVFGYRIVIPELDMTVRMGINYYMTDNGEEEPCDEIILYDGDEKDPMKFSESYYEAALPSLVGMLADDSKRNANPMCYIDDSEFELMED